MSSSIVSEYEAANEQYAAAFNKGDLALPPSRHVAVIAYALRSVIISQQLLGTREIVIVHHTDCGMLTFSDLDLKTKVRKDLGEDVDHIAFLPFGDLEQSVRDDIAFLKKSPLVLDVPITGYIYDVKSGKINKVDA
ncbi:Carbonic anhydrase [Fusarium oxysporum f. sp. vasinfectum]|nr:Carbonic anhydrase [Fusarium oxysporum f. sp. vasinfectum]